MEEESGSIESRFRLLLIKTRQRLRQEGLPDSDLNVYHKLKTLQREDAKQRYGKGASNERHNNSESGGNGVAVPD